MLVMALRPRVKRDVLLVNYIDIDAALEKEFDDVVPATLDGIEDGGLPIVVDKVGVGSIRYEFLNGLKMALSACVKDGRLAVGVHLIHLAVALANEEVNQMLLALSGGIVERGLVQVVRLVNADAHFPQNSRHLYSEVVILDQCSGEHGGLLVVCLIKKLGHVISVSLMLLHHLVDVAILHEV